MRKGLIKYIMFDFDGTIVDSMPFLENNAIFLLTSHYRLSEKEAQKKYRDTTGLPFLQQMEIIAPEKDNTQIIDEFEKMKLERIYEQKLFPNSYKVLEELKASKYLLGISSGTIESIIVEYLHKQCLNFVDDILGWRPGFEKGKDHFDFVKAKYKLSSSNVVFIGDSLNDAKRAKSENIHFIGKKGMFHEDDFEKLIQETPVISSLLEVKGVLKTWEDLK
ncbi:MAG: HAD family hydrolase [Candidatus Thorarchaeota archaeon]